jgi:hypothetical protein
MLQGLESLGKGRGREGIMRLCMKVYRLDIDYECGIRGWEFRLGYIGVGLQDELHDFSVRLGFCRSPCEASA